jgi:hypothetical protein
LQSSTGTIESATIARLCSEGRGRVDPLLSAAHASGCHRGRGSSGSHLVDAFLARGTTWSWSTRCRCHVIPSTSCSQRPRTPAARLLRRSWPSYGSHPTTASWYGEPPARPRSCTPTAIAAARTSTPASARTRSLPFAARGAARPDLASRAAPARRARPDRTRGPSRPSLAEEANAAQLQHDRVVRR